jgi:uncharacterized membrane protein YwzB
MIQGITVTSIADIHQRFRRILIVIGCFHIVVIVLTFWALFELNLRAHEQEATLVNRVVMLNSSLLGFLGSLLYFSRKVYTYLISDKFNRVIHDQGLGNQEAKDVDRLRSVILGYYLYLSTRPIAGLIIGPLLFWSVLAGLTTFAKPVFDSEIAVSKAGTYLIYVISFLGGYSSSDLFDYCSSLGGKLIGKLELK